MSSEKNLPNVKSMTPDERMCYTAECMGRIDAKLDNLSKGSQKLMYAMLGVIAASIGTKVIGTPLILDVLAYASLFTAVFTAGVTYHSWGVLSWPRRSLRIALLSLIMFSTSVRLWVYEVGEVAAPIWFPPAIDIFFIVLCVLLAYGVWRDKY